MIFSTKSLKICSKFSRYSKSNGGPRFLHDHLASVISEYVKPETRRTETSKRKEVIPDQNLRFDRIDHWPEYDEKESRSNCKMDGCKSLTNVYCMKCKVHLCLRKSKNCFLPFHKPN